jgi:hypothetical protein
MPLFDFSTPIPKSKPGYWIYWAVTAPLTISVLAIYLTYLTLISRKNREEDKRAREDVTANTVLIPDPPNRQAKPDNKPHGTVSSVLKVLQGTIRKRSIKGPEPNLELGMSGGGEMTQLPLNTKRKKSSGNIRRMALERRPRYMPSDSEIEEDTVEAVGCLPHIRDVPIQKEIPPVITRHKTFQPQRTDAFSDSDIQEDGVEIVGALSPMRDVPRGPARGQSLTVNRTTLGGTRSTGGYDSDFDSDSSYGL